MLTSELSRASMRRRFELILVHAKPMAAIGTQGVGGNTLRLNLNHALGSGKAADDLTRCSSDLYGLSFGGVVHRLAF